MTDDLAKALQGYESVIQQIAQAQAQHLVTEALTTGLSEEDVAQRLQGIRDSWRDHAKRTTSQDASTIDAVGDRIVHELLTHAQRLAASVVVPEGGTLQ